MYVVHLNNWIRRCGFCGLLDVAHRTEGFSNDFGSPKWCLVGAMLRHSKLGLLLVCNCTYMHVFYVCTYINKLKREKNVNTYVHT